MGQQLALLQGFPETTAPAAGRRGLGDGQRRGQGGLQRGEQRGEQRGGQNARVRMCAACQAKEARYGFREEKHPRGLGAPGSPVAHRPRTLCFECFRAEIGRRQLVTARMARGWTGTQTDLPLADTLDRLDRRRRRAQIAARHAMGV